MGALESSPEFIDVRGAPRIEGLKFLRPSAKPNFKSLANVMQRSRDADRYELVETARDIKDDFRHLQNCNPKKDMICVEADGELVGFCRCEWRIKADGTRIYQHAVHLVPEWRRRGLRASLVRENERRLREIARTHPKRPKKFIEATTSYFSNSWKSLLEREGYEPSSHTLILVRDFRDIPDVPLPLGFEIRPYRKEQLKPIFFGAAEAFRDEPNFKQEFWTNEGMQYFSEWRAFKPRLWQVAWAGRNVAGASINMIDEEENKRYGRKWAYLMLVFVRRPFRKKGLASALISKSLRLLQDEDVAEAALGVDSENPSGARRLYERLGFRERDHYARYRKPI